MITCWEFFINNNTMVWMRIQKALVTEQEPMLELKSKYNIFVVCGEVGAMEQPIDVHGGVITWWVQGPWG